MKVLFLSLFTIGFAFGQSVNEYEISFENAVHHEASVKATFKNLKDDVLEVRMSRSSPGRYAVHEFAKNVYNVKAFDSKGKALSVTRPNPYQWNVSGHDGTVVFTYTLFGDKGDGTYLQIDETHAHLNMPATFAFARGLDHRPCQVKFNVREDLKWKVATQLKPLGGNIFWAPHLQYFMDSPTEISNFLMHEFEEESNGKKYTIRVALHHTGTPADATPYFDGVQKIVKQAKAVMGGLPDFDFGTYTFLSCYMPQASGDGMEHRNSTYCVGTFPLQGEAVNWALSTVSHEFFHCWNVERIRPAALEPFKFEEANMSGELWFAEGFTNYFGDLIRCRAGLISQKDYVESLGGTINYVANSPGLKFFNPIEMSYQAPFADAATSIDPNNRGNTYVSYYPYGEVIGLALDLALRNLSTTTSLDGFMRLVWSKHGKTESPYTFRDLQAALSEYTSPAFANAFFEKYIFKSNMPDYENLFAGMGVSYSKANPGKPYWGAQLRKTDAGLIIDSYTRIGTPAYKAGLESGDIILAINGKTMINPEGVKAILDPLTPGTTITINFKRFNTERTTTVILEENPEWQTKLFEDAGTKTDSDRVKRRTDWLNAR